MKYESEEEIKKKAREMLRNEIAKYPQMDALGTIDIIDSIINLAVSKERERRDAQTKNIKKFTGKPSQQIPKQMPVPKC